MPDSSVWKVFSKKADFIDIGRTFGIDMVTSRIIRNRDIVGDNNIKRFLRADMEDMYDPFLMKGMKESVSILRDKIKAGKKIRIIGDYDIDGVCSTTILMNILTDIGANVSYDVPDRMKDGYGINTRLIDLAIEDGVDTIITCDNGIAAYTQVKYAKEKGMTIIITDHHEIPYKEENGQKHFIIPPADVVINPHQEDCPYPFKELCGAGVAYKLGIALGVSKEIKDLILKFASIATIGDVVDLKDENRIIVKNGLKLINNSEINGHIGNSLSFNKGLSELIKAAGIGGKKLSSYHIGFVIGPCINAGGRLSSAKTGIKLFLSEDMEEVKEIALDLTSLNEERKEMTIRKTKEAIEMVETGMMNDKVLLVYLPDCHEAIAGIVAGRLKEHFYRPSFVVTRGAEGAKGSGRSIEGYEMYEEINKCADLLSKFGGHAMAAGFSLPTENIDDFRRRLNEKESLSEEDLTKTVWIDVPMPGSYVTEKLIYELGELEPFGKGNPKPVFADRSLRITSKKLLGKNNNLYKLTLMGPDGKSLTAIKFKSEGEEEMPEVGSLINILYYPELNEYNGFKTIQLNISEYREI